MMRSKLSLNEHSAFYWQVAALLKSGATPPEAVTTLRLDEDLLKINKIAEKIQKEMAAGSSFAECLNRHNSLFNAALRKILTSDIPNTQKADILQQAAETEERFAAVGATGTALLRSVLWYPMLVLSIAVIFLIILLIFVIPVFEELFNSMGGTLPALTGLIVAFSRPVAKNPLIALLALAVLLVGGKVLFSRTAEKMPVIGPLLRKIATAQFSQYFSLMIAADFSFKESLEGAAESVMNPNCSALLKRLVSQTEGFSDIQAQMRKTGLFPEMLLQMAATAKTPEQLGLAMGEAAVCYSRNISRIAAKNTALLDLLVLLIIGMLIGVLVVSMYLPIFSMSSSI